MSPLAIFAWLALAGTYDWLTTMVGIEAGVLREANPLLAHIFDDWPLGPWSALLLIAKAVLLPSIAAWTTQAIPALWPIWAGVAIVILAVGTHNAFLLIK